MNDFKILFQGHWSDTDVDVAEVDSSRSIDLELEKELTDSWKETIQTAQSQSRKIWDSTIYRFERYDQQEHRLQLNFSTIPFSIRLEMNKHTAKIKELGTTFSSQGLFTSCLVKTIDEYYVFIKKSKVYASQKTYAWVGGILSKSEASIHSGTDLFSAAKREVIEELGIETNNISETVLRAGYLTENWNVCLLFSIMSTLNKDEILERFSIFSDEEAEELLFIHQDSLNESMQIFELKDQIKFKLFNL